MNIGTSNRAVTATNMKFFNKLLFIKKLFLDYYFYIKISEGSSRSHSLFSLTIS